jgi:hypothetical protein
MNPSGDMGEIFYLRPNRRHASLTQQNPPASAGERPICLASRHNVSRSTMDAYPSGSSPATKR